MKENMHWHKHKGYMLMIVGVIVLANELYFKYSWWVVLGVLLILKGLKITFLKGKFKEE